MTKRARKPAAGITWLGLGFVVFVGLIGLVSTGLPGSTATPDAIPAPAASATSATSQPPTSPPADATAGVPAPITPGTARELLETLPIKGRAPKTGYDRDLQFGNGWLDVDRNGCDTRNDILQRDLASIVLSGPCKVMSGMLISPFTGETVDFVRGNTTSTLVQIDHIVALSNAWQTGAQQLSKEQRIAFANDPLNLLAVDGRSNSQKGEGDAATWLPKQKSIRCAYVARQVSVKAKYTLWVTQPEHDAIAGVLDGCPGEPALRRD